MPKFYEFKFLYKTIIESYYDKNVNDKFYIKVNSFEDFYKYLIKEFKSLNCDINQKLTEQDFLNCSDFYSYIYKCIHEYLNKKNKNIIDLDVHLMQKIFELYRYTGENDFSPNIKVFFDYYEIDDIGLLDLTNIENN